MEESWLENERAIVLFNNVEYFLQKRVYFWKMISSVEFFNVRLQIQKTNAEVFWCRYTKMKLELWEIAGVELVSQFDDCLVFIYFPTNLGHNSQS